MLNGKAVRQRCKVSATDIIILLPGKILAIVDVLT